jgi:hypothetical protein
VGGIEERQEVAEPDPGADGRQERGRVARRAGVTRPCDAQDRGGGRGAELFDVLTCGAAPSLAALREADEALDPRSAEVLVGFERVQAVESVLVRRDPPGEFGWIAGRLRQRAEEVVARVAAGRKPVCAETVVRIWQPVACPVKGRARDGRPGGSIGEVLRGP